MFGLRIYSKGANEIKIVYNITKTGEEMLKKYVINVPFTSMYGTPEVGEVISQVIMGEIIDVLSFSSGFAKIV
ncbi:MAG: hypothetical protein ACP5F5_06620, partial [Caldisericum sp.]